MLVLAEGRPRFFVSSAFAFALQRLPAAESLAEVGFNGDASQK